MGVAKERWSNWERDRDVPEAYLVPAMAALLGISPFWLVAGKGEGPSVADAEWASKTDREFGASAYGSVEAFPAQPCPSCRGRDG